MSSEPTRLNGTELRANGRPAERGYCAAVISASLAVCLAFAGAQQAAAQSYLNDIGLVRLQSLLGGAPPTGAGVPVIQVEASLIAQGSEGYPVYAPLVSDPAFANKNFYFPGSASTAASSHATNVGEIFYGLQGAAPNISIVTVYNADDWLPALATPTVTAPYNASRVANDSWVGAGSNASQTGGLLRLADRETLLTGLIQVAGMPYASGNPLLGDCFNVISVGETAAGNIVGTDAIDSVYIAGRTAPNLVAPQAETSTAAPVVAAIAALLVQTAHAAGSSLSTGSTSVSGVGTIYDGEEPATIKAALMAGADRLTVNTSTTANVNGYRSSGFQATNGLDTRYGAGQLNAVTSYLIIAAGEQHSLQGGGAASGSITAQGFDYSQAFGGVGGSPTTATYKFTANTNGVFAATLAWNLGIANNASLAASYYNLQLELYDATTQSIVAQSTSVIDNTQNIWAPVAVSHDYELLVQSGQTTPFSWSYALAWSTQPTPAIFASTLDIASGGLSTLSVTPVGSGPFTYQWYVGSSGDTSTPISGATGSSFTTPALTSTTSYWVRVVGLTGTQNSPTITVMVKSASADGPLSTWALAVLGAGLLLAGSTVLRNSRGRP
jgi:hypothetical protein